MAPDELSYAYWAGRLAEAIRMQLRYDWLDKRSVDTLAEFDAWCAKRREQVES